jgi:hypothetical protein
MHPDLKKIADALNDPAVDERLRLAFACACIEPVAANLEDDAAIEAWRAFKARMNEAKPGQVPQLTDLADALARIANQHPGSKSIDGTRHAAVSATYALSKAVQGKEVEAAAYAAYSEIYGYGGYAVSDPASFAEVHQRQLGMLSALLAQRTPAAPV